MHRHTPPLLTACSQCHLPLSCPYRPKPVANIRVHSWGYASHGFGQRYPPSPYHSKQFHCPKNPLCSTYSTPPSRSPLATTDLFTDSIVLPFPACRIVGFTVCSLSRLASFITCIQVSSTCFMSRWLISF